MILNNVKRIVFVGVRDIAPDYRVIAVAVAGNKVEVTQTVNVDPRKTDFPDDPKFIDSHPELIAHELERRIAKEPDTLLFFSTSTANIPILMFLVTHDVRFGLVEHSPTDGTTLRAYLFSKGTFEEFWTPTVIQDGHRETAA